MHSSRLSSTVPTAPALKNTWGENISLWLCPLALKNADLGVTKPPLVVHRLDGVEYNLGGSLQVGQGSVDLLGLDDDEPVDKVRIHRPVR